MINIGIRRTSSHETSHTRMSEICEFQVHYNLQFTYRIVRFKAAQQGRVYHQCAVVNNRLYVIGGGNPNHLGHLATNTVAIYDISSNQWHTGPSMRSFRHGFVFVFVLFTVRY